MSLLDLFYYIGWALLLLVGVAGGWRILAGPTTLDRMVGFDVLMVSTTAVIGLFSIHSGTGEYMELILIVTALSFFSTVAFYYYLSQPSQQGGDDFNEEEKRK